MALSSLLTASLYEVFVTVSKVVIYSMSQKEFQSSFYGPKREGGGAEAGMVGISFAKFAHKGGNPRPPFLQTPK